MKLFQRNVEYGPPLKLSGWRKVAIGTWKTVGDPSVYGMLDLDVSPALAYLEKLKHKSSERLTLTHFFGKAVAETFKRHPEINCVLRFGKLYPRKHIDLFFQVATDESGKDLSGMTVRDGDQKSVEGFAAEMRMRIEKIRKQGDPDFKKSKNTMSAIPGMLSGVLLDFLGFVMYTLNVYTPLVGSPRDPFGSVMITNIGSLGLEVAFAPLVPYSRVPILLAVGAAKETPVARNGKVEVTQIAKICITLDHRLIDGVHASHMSKTIQKIFADPEGELGLP